MVTLNSGKTKSHPFQGAVELGSFAWAAEGQEKQMAELVFYGHLAAHPNPNNTGGQGSTHATPMMFYSILSWAAEFDKQPNSLHKITLWYCDITGLY